MAKPRIVQVLCGPARHCILALAYEPGVTALDEGGEPLTEATAVEMVRSSVDEMLAGHGFDPWCGICGSKREAWTVEDDPLKFDTLEEAMPALRRSERDQARARRALGRN